jgi:putative flippase GtrA
MSASSQRSVFFQQLLAYGLVGGLSSLIDLFGFIALDRVTGAHLMSSVASFTLATIANYFLSYWVSFVRGRFSRHTEVVRLIAVSVAGLCVNTLTVWILLKFGIVPVGAKIVAIGVVFTWNFLGRRLFVFHRDLAPPVASLVRSEARPEGDSKSSG